LVPMAEYGVERHQPFTISMWLERNGERVEVPGVAFGYALFTCGPRGRPARQSGDGCSLAFVPMPWTGSAG
jgi:hypothetical protein